MSKGKQEVYDEGEDNNRWSDSKLRLWEEQEKQTKTRFTLWDLPQNLCIKPFDVKTYFFICLFLLDS